MQRTLPANMCLDPPTRWDARSRPSHNTNSNPDLPALAEWSYNCLATKVTCMVAAVMRTANVAATRQGPCHTTVMPEARAVDPEAGLWLLLTLDDRSAVMVVQFCTLVSNHCPKNSLAFPY